MGPKPPTESKVSSNQSRNHGSLFYAIMVEMAVAEEGTRAKRGRSTAYKI
jgi:hypothetical protein